MVLMKIKQADGNIVEVPLGFVGGTAGGGEVDAKDVKYSTEGSFVHQEGFDGTLQEAIWDITNAIGYNYGYSQESLYRVSELEALLGYEPSNDYNDIIGLSADFENNYFKRLAGARGLDAGEGFNKFPVYRDRVRCNVADDGEIIAICGDESSKIVSLCDFQEVEIGSYAPLPPWEEPGTSEWEPTEDNCGSFSLELTTIPHPTDTGSKIKIYIKNVTMGDLHVIENTLNYYGYDENGSYIHRFFGTFETSSGSCSLTGWAGGDDSSYEEYFQFFTYPRCTDTIKIKIELERNSVYTDDGSNGQCMVYQPAFYYRVVPIKLDKQENGIGYHIRKANYYISSTPKPGFKLHPAFYDINGKPVKYILYGAYEDCPNWDETENYVARSIAGREFALGNLTSFLQAESYAQARGENWHIENIQAISANQLLMMIEYGCANITKELGVGINWRLSGYTFTTGVTMELGNDSGTVTDTLLDPAISYRGMENPWGYFSRHIHGMSIIEPIDYEYKTEAVYKPLIDNGKYKLDDVGTQGKFCEFTLCALKKLGYTDVLGYASAFGYGTEEYDWLLLPSELNELNSNEGGAIGSYIRYMNGRVKGDTYWQGPYYLTPMPGDGNPFAYLNIAIILDDAEYGYGGSVARLLYLPESEIK